MSSSITNRHTKSRALHRSLPGAKIFVALLLAQTLVPVSRAQWIAFNDHYSGPGTHANATTWNVFGTTGGAPGNSGPLKDIATGANLPVTLTINNSGAAGGATSGAPNAGTPAYNLFNPYIDFGSATLNHAIQTPTAATVSHVFTGLNPGRR